MRASELKKLIKKLYKRRLIGQFMGSSFRRLVLPQHVSVCDHDCNADENCCHQYRIEGVLFCIDYGPDEYGGGNTDYICQEHIKGKWVEVPQTRETEATGREPGWW